GLDLPLGRLLAVDWVLGPGRPPVVAYVYDGGVLDESQLARVTLQQEELISWRLVEPAELTAYLPASLGLRVQEAYRIAQSGEGAAELENGRRPVTS
ncbi:NUDIX hydrolase, partial [Streptomyces nojiriensis]